MTKLGLFLRIILVISFATLVARLAELQIVKGEYFKNLSDGNRVRYISTSAPRGNILARDGTIIAGNVEIKKRIKFDPNLGYTKSPLNSDDEKNKISFDEILSEWSRSYPFGADAAPIIGYVNEAGVDEVGKVDPNCLGKNAKKLGSNLGKTGLEYQYDCPLRGIDGEELIEVDSMGKMVRILGSKNPIKGTDIKTTIDINLQKAVAKAMKGYKGAVVVQSPRGEILSIFSSPSFDPYNPAHSIVDENLPLFNRAISGNYHPGSPFKIVTAIAALEDQKINTDYKYDDVGYIKVNEYEYNNWYFSEYGGKEGEIGLIKGLARSTDTLFYKLGEFLGPDRLSFWARNFGYGAKTGIDLPGESESLVPDSQWKLKTKGENWYLGNSYHFAIGQGDLTATPLQVNSMMATIAAAGEKCTPHINSDIQEKCTKMSIGDESRNEVLQGLIAACKKGGTGVPFFEYPIPVACKTGTAETGGESEPHAWFTIFAPVESPQIVLTVLVEKGGEGSKVAAPIAKKILDSYFVKVNP